MIFVSNINKNKAGTTLVRQMLIAFFAPAVKYSGITESNMVRSKTDERVSALVKRKSLFDIIIDTLSKYNVLHYICFGALI